MVTRRVHRRLPTVCRYLVCIATAWGGSGVGHAAVYRCLDHAGVSIYTDSPAQLDHCAPLGSASSATTTIRSVDAGHSTVAGPDPWTVAPATMPPEESPSDPLPGQPAMGASPPAAVPSTEASGACIPGINPLNPFTVVCGPAP